MLGRLCTLGVGVAMVPPRKLSAVRLAPNPAIGENPERCGYEVNPTNTHHGEQGRPLPQRPSLPLG